jgi:hypothetical protein
MSDSQMWLLERDGDAREQRWWHLFLRTDFPSYETAWQRYIVPVTKRPEGITFRSDAELAGIGKSYRDIYFAQLHYTVVCHLGAAFDIRFGSDLGYDRFVDALVRLCSAQDVAFELLQRHQEPCMYNPDSEEDSREARRDWQDRDCRAIAAVRPVRHYRNRLVHGGIRPYWHVGNTAIVPKIGSENRYLDWRSIADPASTPDYAPADEVLGDAWKRTLVYLETAWMTNLLGAE